MKRRPMLTVFRWMPGRVVQVWFAPLSGPRSSIAMLTLGRRGTISTALLRYGRPARTKVWRHGR